LFRYANLLDFTKPAVRRHARDFAMRQTDTAHAEGLSTRDTAVRKAVRGCVRRKDWISERGLGVLVGSKLEPTEVGVLGVAFFSWLQFATNWILFLAMIERGCRLKPYLATPTTWVKGGHFPNKALAGTLAGFGADAPRS